MHKMKWGVAARQNQMIGSSIMSIMGPKNHDNAKYSDAFKKALHLLSTDGLDGATMVVDRELDRNPESWEGWAAKADILYFQGMHRSALQCCERSIDLNPNNALAWNTRGNALYKLSRYGEAIESYSRAIEIEPLFVKAWYNKKLALEIHLDRTAPKIAYFIGRNGKKSSEKR